MAVFALAVALSPRRKVLGKEKEYGIINMSRWMLFAGLVIMSLHFVLQRTFGFRQMGDLQGPMLNTLFLPTSVLLMNFSMLNILRFGRVRRWEYAVGITVCALEMGILGVALMIAGKGLLADSEELLIAEYICSVLSSSMLLFYGLLERKEYLKIRNSLDQYYDQPQMQMIGWLATSMSLFMILAVATPVLIYSSHLLITLYAVLIFVAISFLVFNFLHYSATNFINMVMAAEVPEKAEDVRGNISDELSADEREQLQQKIEAWLATRSYLRNGITMAEVAQEIGISRQDVTRYLRSMNYSKIGSWLASLRIEEAKRLLKEYPQYTHETIAEKCGFSSRVYFQTTFRNLVGMTPLKWQNLI